MPLKTVFFDMGGTIDTFTHSPEMRIAATPGLQALLSSYGIELHLTHQQLYELVAGGMARYHQWRLASLNEISPGEIWRKYILSDFPGSFPQLEAIAEELMVWYETHYYRRQVRTEIPSVLKALRKLGMSIGLISNVSSRGQVPYSLKEYGIQGFFHPLVLSSEYGRRKPDPSIFHHAARLSNTPTSECAYIGDRISRDILGAKRAGYRLAVQIRHDFDHGESDEGPPPDYIVDNMEQFFTIISDERSRSEKIPPLKSSDAKDIRAVLFDADGILYYRKDQGHELTSFLIEMGIDVDRVPISKLQHFRHQAATGHMTYDEYKRAVLNLYGISDSDTVARGIQISKSGNHDIAHFTGVRETLEILKNEHLYLGIITDTAQPLHVKLEKLERGGIGHFWDTIISSQEVGVCKPDPQIYLFALKQLDLTPQQAIFVGHKSSELAGARGIGMTTVAFNYDPDAKADFYIDHFADLATLALSNLGSRVTR